MTSPTPIPHDSSTQFANDPLLNLLKKPVHQMSPEERRKYAEELRHHATSPQAMGKLLRTASEEKKKAVGRKKGKTLEDNGEDSATTTGKGSASLDDLMKDLEA